MLKEKIGFIGAGQMATALGQGFVKAGLSDGANLLASDPELAALQMARHIASAGVGVETVMFGPA